MTYWYGIQQIIHESKWLKEHGWKAKQIKNRRGWQKGRMWFGRAKAIQTERALQALYKEIDFEESMTA